MEKYLQIGKIVNTHGFKGDVKAQAWSDSPAFLIKLKRIYMKKQKDYI